jgi:hypothetical protein
MKTAVEWFYQRILAKDIESVFEQAKEMEKQQIMDAYNDAENKCEYFIEEHAWQRYHHLSENYYKQTFKSE